MHYKHGGDIYTYRGMLDFSTNINPFGPSTAVIQAASNAMNQIGAYPDSSCRRLRKSLAEILDVEPQTIVIGNGAADLIFSLVFAKKPKKALLTVPSFAEYGQALEAVGCEVVYHELQEENNFAVSEEYLDALTADLDIIFLCSPDNPTGQVIRRELLEKIAKRCEELHISMVLDQCFHEFQENQEDILPTQSIEQYPHLLLLRAFTKMHAIPGLRLGYAVTADAQLQQKLEQVRQPWSVSIPAQEAGIAALEEMDRVRETREYIRRERMYLEKELERMGIQYFPSKANYILLKSNRNLFQLLQKKQILIRDCGNYKGLGSGYYRIAIKKAEENKRLLKALEE